ncbi:MAG TPA: TlyA family RNA methyltransferase [Chloroflexota bacterium]|nr:TlyA family RNA methyltransferase [Chloroflexota bacterium]
MNVRKIRIDSLLVERGLSESRERARGVILAGDVRVNGQVVTKPGTSVPADAELAVTQPPPYVSRGGFKLAHALDSFGLDVSGQVVLDVGASTGGFTDVLLQARASRVYAIDVGYGQLAWRLRQDPRVVVMDRTNIRHVTDLPERADGAVVDVAFISLTVVLTPIEHLLKPDGWIVALVKPQFEAGRSRVGKGGVVRDPEVHREVLEHVLIHASQVGLKIGGCTPSPILGPAGNREFLVLLRKSGSGASVSDAVRSCLGSE